MSDASFRLSSSFSWPNTDVNTHRHSSQLTAMPSLPAGLTGLEASVIFA